LSKEQRSDCPLLTLGLVLDGSGFVRRSQVFDGNVVEGTTLAGMLQGLGAPAGALVVMDRGIATEENLRWLRAQGYRYLVVSRERQRQFDPSAASALLTANGECVSVQRVADAEGEEVRLYCYSPRRAQGGRHQQRALPRASRPRCRPWPMGSAAPGPPSGSISSGSASGG
jgi:hypothetical protein